jgi:oligopeptide/dipeptide ABC transporter ATP-binding protein
MSDVDLLQVRGLVKHFSVGYFPSTRTLVAIDNIDLHLQRGETLGLVGESGSGKTTVARCILRLVEPTGGTIVFDGVDVSRLTERQLRPMYRQMQMVFQDPGSSLNPRMSVRSIVHEPLKLHLHLPRQEREDRARELMELVGLPATHLDRFPHQLSGGQRQRVGIARAIATNPKLVVLDEPTSSLDVSVRGQILELLRDLQARLGLSYLFITHDLSVIRHVCRRVAVMYLGKIVEQGTTEQVFDDPTHPYTRALLSAVPRPVYGGRRERLLLVGEIPSPISLPPSCRLYGRCPLAIDKCALQHPPLEEVAPQHSVACYVTTAAKASLSGAVPVTPERSAS